MMTILRFVPGFKESTPSNVSGPFVAGTACGMKVIVTPILGDKVCYLGLLGNDGKTATGIYAPYMPLVPTQLLGFADGQMEQGFSTLYDMLILNDTLLCKISVSDGNDHAAVDTYAQSV